MHRNLDKLLILILIFALGCSSQKLTVKSARKVKFEEARTVLSEAQKNRSLIPAVRIKADMKIDSKPERFVFKELISLERPRKMQMTSIKFGTPILYLSLGESGARAYDPNDNTYYFGTNYEDVAERLTGLGVGIEDFIEIIFGGIFVPSKFEITDAEILNNRYYKIVIKLNELESREIMVDGQSKTFFWCRINSIKGLAGEEILVQLSDFRAYGNILFPVRITMKRIKPYLEISLKIDEASFPQAISKDELEIKIPRGISALPLEQLGRLF